MTAPGYISTVEVYRLDEARRRLRLGRHSFRRLRAEGLEILRIGRCGYIDGAELVALIKKIGKGER